MPLKRSLGYGIGATAVAALAGISAVRLLGHGVRTRTDAVLDDALDLPLDVVHHRLESNDGGTIHVVDTGGSGPPVLLLHGVTLQWWVWSAVIRALRPSRRVVAWDMRGHGESAAGRQGVALEACADDLALVLERLDLHDAVVVGHSMGGMVLGRFAADHHDVLRDRVAGAVFLATTGSPLSITGLSGGLVALGGTVAATGRIGARNPQRLYSWKPGDTSAALIRVAFGSRATGRMVDDVRRMLAATPPRTLAEAGAAIADHDVLGELAEVDCPSVVVVGVQDRLTPPGHARKLVDTVAGAEYRELPGIGHQVMQEAPEEVVAAIERVDRLSADRAAARVAPPASTS